MLTLNVDLIEVQQYSFRFSNSCWSVKKFTLTLLISSSTMKKDPKLYCSPCLCCTAQHKCEYTAYKKSSEQIKENDLVKHLLNIGLFCYCKQSAVFESLASIYFLPTDVFICDLNAITTWWRCRCESCRLHGATLSFCVTCFVPAWLVWPSSFKKHRSVNRCFFRGTKGSNNQCDVAVVTLSVCLLKCERLVSVC